MYIGLGNNNFKSQRRCFEMFKCAYKHIPCVTSAYRAIYDTKPYIAIYQSEGVSPERDIWSLCVFACRWLWGMALVGSSCRRHSVPLPLGGYTNRQKPQDTCSKIPGRVFSEGAEPPEAGHHQSHSSGELPPRGDFETGENVTY